MALEAMGERLANIDHYGRSDADPTAEDTTAGLLEDRLITILFCKSISNGDSWG
jgi:hypothetical protein